VSVGKRCEELREPETLLGAIVGKTYEEVLNKVPPRSENIQGLSETFTPDRGGKSVKMEDRIFREAPVHELVELGGRIGMSSSRERKGRTRSVVKENSTIRNKPRGEARFHFRKKEEDTTK